MTIERITSSCLLSNMYFIREENHIIVIDPCIVDDFPDDCKLDYILLTHEHIDHISGVNYWKSLTGAPVLCNKECADNIKNPKKNMSHYFEAFSALQTWAPKSCIKDFGDYSCIADEVYSDEYIFYWCGHTIRCFSTPGHSEGSSCILVDDKYAFSGDSLIKGFEPTLRFPGGSKKMWLTQGMPRLKELDVDTLIYPGHFDEFLLSEYEWT